MSDAIDLIWLYTNVDHVSWNEFLTDCYHKHDILKLIDVRKRLQKGMANLAKQKLNAKKLDEWFLRITTSIELTLKKIQREKSPNPCDNPLIAKQWKIAHAAKKERDHDLELFLKRVSH